MTTRQAGPAVLTVGHSNHSASKLLDLLRAHRTAHLVDVRTTPTSSFAPQFDRKALREFLQAHGIDYSFLGRQLGGRPAQPRHYDPRTGRARYDLEVHTLD